MTKHKEEEEGFTITQKYINKTLKIPSNIKEMDLSSKNIFKGKVLEFQNLKKLNLSNNQLENVDFLRNLTKLEELNLSNNHLDKISKIFKYLENLEKLNLTNNHIEDFKNLKYLKNLKNLKIDIQTSEQEEEIKKLKNLKKLNGNTIKREANRKETNDYIIESFDVSLEPKKEKPKEGTLINKIEMKEIGKLVGGYSDTDKSGLLELVSGKKKKKNTPMEVIFQERKEETW
jgi:hypothetical protein